MSLGGIITALVALVQPLPAVGQVWHYERVNVPPEDMQAVFGFDDAQSARGWSVRAWMWHRSGVEEGRDLSNEVIVRTHRLCLHAYWETNDSVASEVECRDTTETIVNALRAWDALQPDAALLGSPRVTLEGYAMIGGILCHEVEILTDVQEYLDAGSLDFSVPLLRGEG